MATPLTERDQSMVADVWRYRYVTTRQLARLHFAGHVKLAQRRLRVLTERGLVDRFRLAAAPGLRGWWYRLARAGADVLVEACEIKPSRLLPPRRRPQSWGFLQHHAAVVDFRIWLREACASASGFAYAFVPDYDEVRVNGRRSRRIALPISSLGEQVIPDGAFTLSNKDHRALFLLEVDRGTEPLTGKHANAITKKFLRYRSAFDTQAEHHYTTIFARPIVGFRIVCLVPTAQRAIAFVRLAEQLDLAPLVWVATRDLVDSPGDLNAPAWMTREHEPPRHLTE